MDNARYSDMRSCAQQVGLELDSFAALAAQQGLNANLVNPVRARLAHTPLRAYFMSKMYAYLRACPDFDPTSIQQTNYSETFFTQKIPFIYEVIITIQYLHNQILDGKCGVVSGEKINDHLLSANLLKDLLYDYIESSFPAEIGVHISKNVRTVFRYVDLGQQLEKNWSSFDHYQSSHLTKGRVLPERIDAFLDLEDAGFFAEKVLNELAEDKRPFATVYLKRIYLTCAALFKMGVQLLLDLTNYQGKEYRSILSFASSYGMMRQIVNDNADFIPSFFQLSTKGKVPGDAFSDLRNKNVTLPLLFLLEEKENTTINAFLEGKLNTIDSQEDAVFEEMLNSFALLKSIQNAKLLASIATNYLDSANLAYAFIADSCKIAEWNKFIFPCYRSSQYKYYKKTAYYKQTKTLITAVRQKMNIQHEEPAPGGMPQQGTSRMPGQQSRC